MTNNHYAQANLSSRNIKFKNLSNKDEVASEVLTNS